MVKVELLNYIAVAKRINELGKKINDFKPIWEKFVPEFQKDVIANMNIDGKLTNGGPWQNLSEKYAMRKTGRKVAKSNLNSTGKLRGAIQGGAGWEQKINGKSLEVGINLPYAAIHQYGGSAGKNGKSKIPQRAYFFQKDTEGALIPRTLTKLYKIILKYLGLQK